MPEPKFKYDEPSDSLYISFAPGENATGIELHAQILLRVDKAARCAVGLTLFDYSLLAQPTELGVRSLPLTGLADLTPALRELVLEILRASPLREILSLSTYTPSPNEAIPITSLQPSLLTQRAV